MVPASPLEVITWSIIGGLIGLAVSWVPGFHIVNLIVVITLLTPEFIASNPYLMPYFALGALVSFAFMSSVSATYLSISDDSLMLMLFPSQRYMLMGYGHRAVLLYLVGAMGGVLFLVIFGLTTAPLVIPVVFNLFSPFYAWVLAAIVLFMFLSEWPKEGDRELTGLRRFLVAWRQLAGGLIVFFASGVLGLYVNYSSIIPAERAFARLTPLFIGFFGFSWVLRNIISRVHVPKQDTRDLMETNLRAVLAGVGSGVLGGGIAAFFPVITGGMGALVSGHMVSSRGDDTFMISQGAARVVYYVGALLLLFTPTARITRGAVAWIVQGIYTPKTWIEYYYALFTVLLVASLSFIATLYMSKAIARLLQYINYVHLSIALSIVLAALSYMVAGVSGVLLMLVASTIGFTALVFNTRLSYCLGALILPVLLSMTGTLDPVLRFLGVGLA
ncbi:MAG: tripartite tricarboxylate transporter permease [Desulfurococcaceae archaeon]